MAAYSSHNDHVLLDLVEKSDYAAFTELYARHADALYGAAYNILRDRQGCKDVVQDIFTWFWQNREDLEVVNCRAYLLIAVKFKTANYIRDNKVGKGFFAELSTVEVLNEDLETAIEVRELAAFIKKLADQLPGKYGEIFRLSRYEQLSNKEIALKMGISEKTVENQMTIALKKLKEKLGPRSAFLYFFL